MNEDFVKNVFKIIKLRKATMGRCEMQRLQAKGLYFGKGGGLNGGGVKSGWRVDFSHALPEYLSPVIFRPHVFTLVVVHVSMKHYCWD